MSFSKYISRLWYTKIKFIEFFVINNTYPIWVCVYIKFNIKPPCTALVNDFVQYETRKSMWE